MVGRANVQARARMSLAAHYAAALSRPTRADAVRSGVSGDDVPWHEERTPAAVLVAITDRPTPGLILTQRPDHMRNHAGQIAFPGGRVDPEDADVVAAALREAREEIALDPSLVHVFGTSDVYHTGTGYHITPVLATIPADLPLRPNEGEVADVFGLHQVPRFTSYTPIGVALPHEFVEAYEVNWLEHLQ